MLSAGIARVMIDGRPHWRLATGRTIPVVHGGEGPDDPPADPPSQDPPPADDDEPLGDAGVKALNAWKERARKAEADARRAAELQAKLDALEAAQMTEQEKAIAAAREEAAAATRAEVLGQANARLFSAELRAASAGKLLDSAITDLLVDPTVALRLLGLDEYPVTDSGDIDGEAISHAVADYVAARPHLAASATQKPGSVDQGARHTPPPRSLEDEIAEAERTGDWARAGRLKTQLMLTR